VERGRDEEDKKEQSGERESCIERGLTMPSMMIASDFGVEKAVCNVKRIRRRGHNKYI
jgi:hypothetical protein